MRPRRACLKMAYSSHMLPSPHMLNPAPPLSEHIRAFSSPQTPHLMHQRQGGAHMRPRRACLKTAYGSHMPRSPRMLRADEGNACRVMAACQLPAEVFSSLVAFGSFSVCGCRDDHLDCLRMA